MDLSDRLSKSRFAKGLQCPLRLYYSVHDRDLADEISAETQALFDKGNAVGELAQKRFPGGILIEEDHFHQHEAVAATLEAMESQVPAIFEAAFTFDNVKVRVDVLHRLDDGGWELIEVKSTGSFKEEKHLPDAGIQLYVLRGAGVDVRRVSLMHMNMEYIYPGGDYDLDRLLVPTDITDSCEAYIDKAPGLVAEMMEMLGAPSAPLVPHDTSCTSPNKCEFFGHCHRDDPVNPITELCTRRSGLYRELTERGIQDILDIPSEFLSQMNPVQEMHCRAVKEADLVTDPSVLSRIDDLVFPLHFADFETVSDALPVFVGTSPFQAVKVQWSLHSLHADGHLEHSEFLVDTSDVDPSEMFLESLLDALENEGEARGTFIHYSPYERTQLLDLALRVEGMRRRFILTFPGWRGMLLDKLEQAGHDTREIMLVRAEEGTGLETFDLGSEVVRTGCYHPKLHGGWTIKNAIDVLAPQLPPYSSMTVSNGQAAMRATVMMLDARTPRASAVEIRKALLDYCSQDTMSMVHIYRTLKDLASR